MTPDEEAVAKALACCHAHADDCECRKTLAATLKAEREAHAKTQERMKALEGFYNTMADKASANWAGLNREKERAEKAEAALAAANKKVAQLSDLVTEGCNAILRGEARVKALEESLSKARKALQEKTIQLDTLKRGVNNDFSRDGGSLLGEMKKMYGKDIVTAWHTLQSLPLPPKTEPSAIGGSFFTPAAEGNSRPATDADVEALKQMRLESEAKMKPKTEEAKRCYCIDEHVCEKYNAETEPEDAKEDK